MTAADEAYQTAQAAIAEALEGGDTFLSLDQPPFHALAVLPPEISSLTSLENLDFSNTQVGDLAPLSGMTGLGMLTLSNTPVSDLAPLSGLTGLRMLDLTNTQVSDLAPLSGMTGLGMLYLANTHVSDLAPLSGLTGLRVLDLTSTQVSDLAPLSGMTRMTKLHLANTQVSNLAPLSGITRLSMLYLTKTKVLDLRPLLQMLADASDKRFHLRIAGIPATQDPAIAQIAALEDPIARAVALYQVLEGGWAPLGPLHSSIPPRKPAPLEIEVSAERITLAGADGLPRQDANARAAMGWQALRDYRGDFADAFNVGNYAPLPAYLAAFDRAMGDAYDPARVVRIGVQAQRLITLTQDQGFAGNLPDGAAADLRGLGAEMMVYLNRFPDWVAYRDDAESADPAGLQDDAAAFAAIGQVLRDTEQVDPAIGQEYAAEIVEAMGPDASAAGAKALMSSTREMSRAMAEFGVDQRRLNRALAKKGGALIDGLIQGPLGIPAHLMRKMEMPLRHLATRYPVRLGWIGRWYDDVFGTEDDHPSA